MTSNRLEINAMLIINKSLWKESIAGFEMKQFNLSR